MENAVRTATISVIAVAFTATCHPRGSPLFEMLESRATGVAFVNELPEATDVNIVNYLNYYNGGGVAAGDIDGDGLPDLYFTSNLGRDRLYRNKGNFEFEDITERAGVGSAPGWTSGVTMADVNGDGQLDIYVSVVSHLTLRGRSVLYINRGDGTFTDQTDAYGLGQEGYSTQAAFFDYDGDGDLDVYLLRHSTHEQRDRVFNPERHVRHPSAGDRLLRNDGTRFVDVSEAAGILGGVEGYGLGVVVSDFNLDGCPDIYVANDFDEGDYLYQNRCDGSFVESIATAMRHTSRSSMGVDAADFNNDGRPDVIVLDMLPEREAILKSSANADDFNVERRRLAAGYFPQVARNTLQLNRGASRFSDVGYLAGVFATDWSWAPLFADLDNDGLKDLFVTNGIYRRPNDLDFYDFVADRAVQEALASDLTPELLSRVLEKMPHVPLANYAYRNDGDLTFTNQADAWGLGRPGFSTGAAYVDLDRDGALDLVVNNINAPAGIYRNRARTIGHNHYLAIELRGARGNTAGIGAKVTIEHAGVRQFLEQMPTRGFQSSVDPRLHFGLGGAMRVDSLIVVWPDGRSQVLHDVPADQTITLSQADAVEQERSRPAGAESRFVDATAGRGLDWKHVENVFFDYNREPLIPHQLSMEGPALTIGDLTGDGLDDLYVGGAKWQAGQLLVQQRDGTFRRVQESAFQADSLSEDVDAAFFDADGDGDLDLYVVSGGNEFWGDHAPLSDRLYLNDGAGRLRRSIEGLPTFFENGSTVAPADYDGDGDIDLFVGGRVVSRRYGLIPRSYLLQNDGAGRFRDVTLETAPGLSEAGMVTSAVWLDYDRDGATDLVVVGEWMPIRVFHHEAGRLVDRTREVGLAETNGWWNHVAVADVQGDGWPDLIVGNLGLNAYVRAFPMEPARLYLTDVDRDSTLEQIVTFYKHGVSYPVAGRDELIRLIPDLRTRYPTYASFGASQIQDILSSRALRDAQVREADVFASSLALNRGNGSFDLRPLPIEAQFAPVFAILSGNFDEDGHLDLVIAGNFFGAPPVQGRYDASYGQLLAGDGTGGFTAVELETSGLVIEGQVRSMKPIRLATGGSAIVVARNDDTLILLRRRHEDVTTFATRAP